MKVEKGELQAQIDAFYASLKAKSLLVALDWAGSAGALSEAAGMKRNTANQWAYRKAIPPRAALILARVEGFPLTANEMCPDVEWSLFKRRQCHKCHARTNPPRYRAGCRFPVRPTVDGSRKASSLAERGA